MFFLTDISDQGQVTKYFRGISLVKYPVPCFLLLNSSNAGPECQASCSPVDLVTTKSCLLMPIYKKASDNTGNQYLLLFLKCFLLCQR